MLKFFALLVISVFAEAKYAEASGAMPTVGGYSKRISTVGIVTQVASGASGQSDAFVIPATSFSAQDLSVGAGLSVGDRIWVDSKGLVRLTDTRGNRVTIAGPAVVEMKAHDTVHIMQGAVKFKTAEGQSIGFTHATVAGRIDGEGAVWASAEGAQVLGLAGSVRAWHPRLHKAPVEIAPGFFSESSLSTKHLHPSRPSRADEASFQAFLAKFEKSLEDRVEVAARGLASEKPASEKKSEHAPLAVARGSRGKADVIESRDDAVIERMHARMAGKDVEEWDERPLAAPGAPRDAYGRIIRPANKGRGLARAGGPSIEVVKEAQKPSGEHAPAGAHERYEEKNALLKRLRKLGDRIEVSE